MFANFIIIIINLQNLCAEYNVHNYESVYTVNNIYHTYVQKNSKLIILQQQLLEVIANRSYCGCRNF